MLISKWSFYKAGQGCFYGGRIRTRGSAPFTFVYDCGSKQGSGILRDEVKRFKADVRPGETPVLDLLVLSHFDEDHISEVARLLKGFPCRIAVLPYLHLLERLFLYFSAGFSDGTDDDELGEFIRDPAGFLLERGVEQVIFLDGNDEAGRLDAQPKTPDNPGDSGFSGSENEPRDLFEMEVLLAGKESEELNGEQLAFLAQYQGRVEFRKANGGIRAGKFWEFFFYQLQQPPGDIDRFRALVESAFGVSVENGTLDGAAVAKIFGSRAGKQKLKSLFAGVFGDPNPSGIILMHGPAGQYATRFTIGRWWYESRYCYTLLNGDTDLHNPLPPYILNRLNYTRVFQVPHHGALPNWSSAQLGRLMDSSLVLNYGTKNTHGHPVAAVCAEILGRAPDWQLHHNTELQEVDYVILVYRRLAGRAPTMAPMHLRHRPVISTVGHEAGDDPWHNGAETDVQALSIGHAQWDDPDAFAVKVWRWVGQWSPQSEEVPVHRALDLALLVVSALIEERTHRLPGNHLQLRVVQPGELEELRAFLREHRGVLEERLVEMQALLDIYWQRENGAEGA